ncbi:MAG: (2Fe-2S)-binding protein [Phycisphaerales bacterium]|jgi:NAD(P)H-nitrite reductase large subunit|nr:(2Fe-2S)-binding protein [Phycisphaerales bacterium]
MHQGFQDDDEVCLCFHVTFRKLKSFLNREQPQVSSQLCNCLDAGTGCGWCRPFLEKMHRQWKAGESIELNIRSDAYAEGRARHLDSEA